MIDVTLFLDRRFSAACAAVTIAFFALFGFIFLITQFFQFVRDYTPLETGVRFLPVALSHGRGLDHRQPARAPARHQARGHPRAGHARRGVPLDRRTIPADVDYFTVVVPQMVLLGGGIGLVSTPATESIMQVLPPARAGVGSAVNDATRELGGTLGVAVVGSLFSFRYADSLIAAVDGRLDGATADAAGESVGFADALTARVPGLSAAVDSAFLDGLALGCTVVGVLCLVGALASAVALPGNRYDPLDAAGPDAGEPETTSAGAR